MSTFAIIFGWWAGLGLPVAADAGERTHVSIDDDSAAPDGHAGERV